MKTKPIRYALFRIYGRTLDPDEITALVERKPDYSHRIGEPVSSSKRHRSQGMWQISSKDSVHSLDLEDHILWVLDQLGPVQAILKEVMNRDGIKADLFCFWQQESNEGIAFNPVLLGRVASLDLELGIEVM